jgi:hypothetical protein
MAVILIGLNLCVGKSFLVLSKCPYTAHNFHIKKINPVLFNNHHNPQTEGPPGICFKLCASFKNFKLGKQMRKVTKSKSQIGWELFQLWYPRDAHQYS